MAYSSHISWQTPDSPVPVELYPSLAFDSLFENRGSLRNQSILDRVRDRAEALSTQISSTDKTKLDEYLSSVREVEKRVGSDAQNQGCCRRQGKRQKTQPPSPWNGPPTALPDDLREHGRLMCDIIAIAFQTELKRVVASMVQARDISALYYPFLDVKDGHHGESHNNLSDGYERYFALPPEPDGVSRDEARQHCRKAMAPCSTTPC